MGYETEYLEKRRSPEEVAARVQSGWSCCTDIAASIPPALMEALGQRAQAGELTGVTLHTMLDLWPMSALRPEAFPGITPVSWFSGGGLREAANQGRGDLMPCYYRDMPELFRDHVEVDAFLAAASPMDGHGYFSLGLAGSVSSALIQKARHIYLEVNPRLPRVASAPMVHLSQVTALCEHEAALPVSPPVEIDPVSRTIGELIAAEVPDGATLQLGIGAVPEAVGLALREKRELGIHTELFTDSMVELLTCGAATNEHKPLYRGKSVATLTFGSQRIYDYINDNPAFLMLPGDQVNDPAVIAQHPSFISVNAALEVDLFGQVCAESMGTRHISGTGGQADYVRGATHSKGGKSFIAFPSTAKGGTVSRIASTLTLGAVVTTSKNDVDRIVTEYGIAELRGRTLSQRTRALIAVAHPDHRDRLTFEAKKRNILI